MVIWRPPTKASGGSAPVRPSPKSGSVREKSLRRNTYKRSNVFRQVQRLRNREIANILTVDDGIVRKKQRHALCDPTGGTLVDGKTVVSEFYLVS